MFPSCQILSQGASYDRTGPERVHWWQAFLSEIKVIGGYLNFYVDKAQYAQQIIDKYNNATDYGCSDQW